MPHTPLPWTAHDRIETGDGVLITDADGMIAICRVVQHSSPCSETPDSLLVSADVCRANADLIIQAANCHYDLLEVAQLITLVPLQHGINMPDELMRLARAAIDKATTPP